MKKIVGLVAAGCVAFACGGVEDIGTTESAVSASDMDVIISDPPIGGGSFAACGHDFSDASATIKVKEKNDGTTKVTVKVKKAVPNHIYTMWLKVDGASPLSGIGATPAAPTTALEALNANADTGIATPGGNAFYTNSAGNGTLQVTLDFHLSDNNIPFSNYTGNAGDDRGVGSSPFTFRVISHCTDGLQHGWYPGPHEATFQISL